MPPALIQAIQQVLLRPDVWLIVIASAFYGVFMGAVPGLTATMAVALLVPVVYFMDPVAALAALVTRRPECPAAHPGDPRKRRLHR
jgi:TctA family transporter